MRFDVVIIGGGLSGMAMANALVSDGKRVAVISRGRSLHKVDYHGFESAGGYLLMGDEVVGANVDDCSVTSVVTMKLGTIEADSFVLATGKYFAGGIKTDMDNIYEPIFGCDISSCERPLWFSDNFSDDQPFMYFGIITDESCHPLIGCKPFTNLYAAGEILAGISATDSFSRKEILRSADKVVRELKKR